MLAQRLGHSDVSITLSLYAHVRPSDDRAASALVAAAIDQDVERPRWDSRARSANHGLLDLQQTRP